MKKLFSLLLALLSFPALAQGLSFKDCESPACNEEKLHALFSETQTAVFEYYGFAYNDSIAIEFTFEDGDLELESSYAWVNEYAINYYFAVLEGNVDLLNLMEDSTYLVYWNQELDLAWNNLEKIGPKTKYPLAKDCRTFNKKAQLACAKYFADYDFEASLEEYKIEEDIRAEIYFTKGKPTAIKLSRVPLENKEIIDAFKLYMESYEDRFLSTEFDKSDSYSYAFESLKLTDLEKSEDYFEDQFAFYIDNKLWKQLKRAIDPYNIVPAIDTAGNTYEYDYGKAMYLYLEAQLSEGRIPNRMWTFGKSTLKVIEAMEQAKVSDDNSFVLVDKAPIYPGCDEDLDNEALKRCFEMKVLQHVSRKFKFPEEARNQGIQGKIYVYFIIEKDASIDIIEISRSTHPLLDLEAIRVVSLISQIKPASQDGEPVRMSFTLPINAKLE